jgi:hypothetical protein
MHDRSSSTTLRAHAGSVGVWWKVTPGLPWEQGDAWADVSIDEEIIRAP